MIIAYLFCILFNSASAVGSNSAKVIESSAQASIRQIVEPVLERYCTYTCKLLGINVFIDTNVKESLAPGFDDDLMQQNSKAEVGSAIIKILFDEKLSKAAQKKIISLLGQLTSALEYPVKVEGQSASFPLPKHVENKINELKNQSLKKFSNAVEEVLQKFCPEKCMLAELDITTELVSVDPLDNAQSDVLHAEDVSLKVNKVSATLLIDDQLPLMDQKSIYEAALLKARIFKNVDLQLKSIHFPKPSLLSNPNLLDAAGLPIANNALKFNTVGVQNKQTETSKVDTHQQFDTTEKKSSEIKAQQSSQLQEQSKRVEKFERVEKIDRIENGNAVQQELKVMKIFGLFFCAGLLGILLYIALAVNKKSNNPSESKIQFASVPTTPFLEDRKNETSVIPMPSSAVQQGLGMKRFEIERLKEDLLTVFMQNPKVCKIVFSNLLVEEGIEVTSKYLYLFGENVFIELLKDPSLQSELNDLIQYYSKMNISLDLEEELNLLQKLQSQCISAKLLVSIASTTAAFDFLSQMDAHQVQELMRGESDDVKAIILTQCDSQKRSQIFSQVDSKTRMTIMSKLSQIDHLPKNYIYNVALALKRKRKDSPRLNTESLSGAEVLLSLLEKTDQNLQKIVVKSLESENPDTSKMILSKLVSLDTLRYLRDGQLLEIILSLRHDELLQFLKGCSKEIREVLFSKAPKDLVADLEEELLALSVVSKDAYSIAERKLLSKIKTMAHEGQINLSETNERMFNEYIPPSGFANSV